MKTLHLHLIRQVLATLVMTVFVFTFVLILGNGLKAIMPILINQQAPFMLVAKAVLLLIPWVLAYALPIGMLTATLLVFGRFSADQELIAARASGISLVSLAAPILVLSVILSVLCGLLNCEIAPRCRVAFLDLLYRPGAIRADRLVRGGQNIQIGQNSIYVDKVAPDGVHLETIRIWISDTNGDLQRWVQAPRGTISFNPTNQILTLNLEDSYGAVRESGNWTGGAAQGFNFEINLAKESSSEMSVSDMSLRQLIRGIDQAQKGGPPIPAKDQPDALKKNLKEMQTDLLTPLEVHMHREIAFSFACIGFTLVGIPLGIRSNRRETSVGILIALILLTIYYSFIGLALAWTNNPERYPQLIMWLPNLIFQAVGGFLLWRANRKG